LAFFRRRAVWALPGVDRFALRARIASSIEIPCTDLFEIIRTTRSMRLLKPDPVPNELIRKILEAGVCAPSGGICSDGGSW
jgi:hypothetical protein